MYTRHMLPQSPIPNENEDRLLPPAQKSSAGPLIGIIIIIVLLVFGALYFWGAHLNSQSTSNNQVPYIPAGDSGQTLYSTTTAS